VRIGGTEKFNGVTKTGAKGGFQVNKYPLIFEGILATQAGMKNLKRLRNEAKPGNPLFENFLVLDADNFIEPVSILRLIATMNNSFMVWQPAIQFYNRTLSLYSYEKEFANRSLGDFSFGATTLLVGGIRAFGKYAGRFKMFYYENIIGESKYVHSETLDGVWRCIPYSMLLHLVSLPIYGHTILHIALEVFMGGKNFISLSLI
jgi:hypothetical protein